VEAVAALVTPSVLVKVEGVVGTAQAGHEIAQQDVEPPELRQVVGMVAVGDNNPVVAVGRAHGRE